MAAKLHHPINPIVAHTKPAIVPHDVLNAAGGDELRGEQYQREDLVAAGVSVAAISQAKSAHTFMRERFFALVQALKSEDPLMTAEANFMEIKKRGDSVLNEAARHCEAARNMMERTIVGIENDIGERMKLVDSPRSNEIRLYVRAMRPGDRTTFILKAIEADDRETLASIFAGPAYLSGLDDKERDMHQNHFREKVAPDLIARKSATEKAAQINDAAFNQFIAAHGSFFPKARIDEITARLEAAKARKDAVYRL